MRRIQRFVFCVAIFGCALVESAKSRPLRPRASDPQTVSAAAGAGFHASQHKLVYRIPCPDSRDNGHNPAADGWWTLSN